MAYSKEILDEVALSQKEYELILEKLGREPTIVEVGMFGSLWSEHCGYKHSKQLLKNFPSQPKGSHFPPSERVGQLLVKPGEENAGVVDIGEGMAIAMKIESHNHPSAIEPYQGAATGVGGIVRDIFTMGARPIALLNSLRFGPLNEPRNRHLFNGVVGGIGGYGNCLGIPDVGGEVFFAEPYSANPLVNAMCVGIGKKDRLIKARASGSGNLVMLVGADTGRDGLHGASGLASRTFEEQTEMRSAVQVGNPFLEKLLLEACLELAGTDWIVGMQDLGAAGLTSSTVECAAKGKSGMEIDVLKVARREEDMTPYEVMLSESQERMLVIVKRGYEEQVLKVLQKWDLRADIIGTVTGDGLVRVKEGSHIEAEVPVDILMNPPFYRLHPRKPSWLKKLQSVDLSSLQDIDKKSADDWLLKLLGSPNICSKVSVYRQYDHQVINNTVIPPGGDAAVLRIKDTGKGIALTTDGNGRHCYLNPYFGGAMAVAEAARNIICSGAIPIAITDCLNFGNPEKEDIFYQLKECVRGMARACRILDVPVISGNVSLYNETRGEAVYPTPVVGMLGFLPGVEKCCHTGFRQKGDIVFLLGGKEPAYSDLAGSEYLEYRFGLVAGNPVIDLALEKRVQRCVMAGIRQGIIKSAHDCSDGGLAVALAECCITGGIGFSGSQWSGGEILAPSLFGEASSRIVISVAASDAKKLKILCDYYHIPIIGLGTVGGSDFILGRYINIPLRDIEYCWKTGLV